MQISLQLDANEGESQEVGFLEYWNYQLRFHAQHRVLQSTTPAGTSTVADTSVTRDNPELELPPFAKGKTRDWHQASALEPGRFFLIIVRRLHGALIINEEVRVLRSGNVLEYSRRLVKLKKVGEIGRRSCIRKI